MNLNKLVPTALPVIAERMALPESAGRVDPLEYLKEEEQAQFGDWSMRELPGALERPAIRPCHRLAADQEGPLFQRLAAAGMGRLHTESEVRAERSLARGRPCSPSEPLDAGGLFAVRHKPTKDRLIYDRRP